MVVHLHFVSINLGTLHDWHWIGYFSEISRTPPLSRSISNCPASVTYLKCAYTSEQNRINITWFKNNREIGSTAFYSQKDDFSTSRPNDYVVLPNGTLEIIRTDSSNEGRYECRVVTATDIIKSNQYVLHDADGKIRD